MGTTMVGKRCVDGGYINEPGGYAKFTIREQDGTTSVAWIMQVPTGGSNLIIGRPNADGSPFHWVRENEDGTITVEANPADAPEDRRNSNSIKFNGWHGYIRNGVWEPLDDSA